MKLLPQRILSGLKALLNKDERSQEMDEELRSYLEAATRDKMRSGMSQAEAMRASRVEMGSTEAVKQRICSSGWESAAESVWHDVRYGVRQLLRSPGFSIVAILTLALGIGANAAIFTLVHAVMLKQLPIANPHQLYRIGDGETYCCDWTGLQDSWGTFDYKFYLHLRDQNPAFSEVAAFSGHTPTYSVRRAGSQAPPNPTNGEYVSGNYFHTLGLQSALGRLLTPGDDTPAAPSAAVMSYHLWQEQYASDASLVGSTLLINGLPFTLVGIAPPGFYGDRVTPNPPELWLPINQQPVIDKRAPGSLFNNSGDAWLFVIARLRPGVMPAQAQAQITLELQQYLRSEGREDDPEHKVANQHILLTPGGNGISSFRSNSKSGLYLLSATSVLVLLIACANLANLLLARGATRQQQVALRLSLGATRSRLIRSVLTESLVLSLTGGAVGLLLAYLGTRAILLIVFRGANFVPIQATPSLPVLGFALLLSILTGIFFGTGPAWLGTRANPSDGLRGNGRSTQAATTRPQRLLVVLQTALSIVLLAVAGLVTQSLRNLEHADLGFQTQGRLLASITPGAAGFTPAQLPALYPQLQDRLESIPGVRSASFSLNSPQNMCCISVDINIGGRSDSWIENTDTNFSRVSPHYFQTIGTPVLRGRPITDQDTPASRHVVVVDENFVRIFFPHQDPIGQHFGLANPGHAYDYEIVGVVKNTRYRSPSSTPKAMFFLPFAQSEHYTSEDTQHFVDSTLYPQSIQLSVNGRPENFVNALRSALAGINPNLTAIGVRSYTDQVANQFNQERLIARLTGLFSVVALLLASIGLYGVTAFNVTRRTSEIGVRMALGANRADVVQMVLRSAFLQVGIGVCIGIPAAILCGRYLAHQLYSVGRFDPLVLGGATVMLCICTAVAATLPARRAASIEPVEALRND
jgi:predicted permease